MINSTTGFPAKLTASAIKKNMMPIRMFRQPRSSACRRIMKNGALRARFK